MQLPGRIETLEAHRAAGGLVAAVYPVRAPRGLLRAYGYLPVEVWGPPRAGTTEAGAYIQGYVCSVARCGLSWLLQGGLELTDLIVIPHACDALQGLGSIVSDFHRPRQPVWPLYLPRGEGEVAEAYLVSELRAGAERLAAASGNHPTPDAILAAIRREEAADAVLGELLDARRTTPLSNRDFLRLARSREYLPAERFIELVREVLAAPGTPPEADGVPVVLSGILCEPMSILDTISDAGGLVVADDLAATGRRARAAGTSDDPFVRSAQGLLSGAPCSTLGPSAARRADWLSELAARSGARAVIFLTPRSCEPEQFYRPLLQRALRERGLRDLVLEVEIDAPLPQQAVTRIEALLETL